ncbi:hypothetical protein EV192_108412 [Actinocrispum wychmicini]|uniref:Uncharacterized protein n=1 Tax=Actinocrispum wychmicini TaxID=1213861 RepID=A0A4R2J8W7_9PSEU|nr:hypothetical protein EV192_108412 [Actinocrispum wychmicini]
MRDQTDTYRDAQELGVEFLSVRENGRCAALRIAPW